MIESLWKGVPLSELSHAQLAQVIEALGKENRRLHKIAAAAGRVRCATCEGAGYVNTYGQPDCPDCIPLRELLEVVR